MSFPSARSKKPRNICQSIINKEYLTGKVTRKNVSMLKRLVCDETAKFQKVWSKSSSSKIHHENSRLYFSHYNQVYHWAGTERGPRRLYKLNLHGKKIINIISSTSISRDDYGISYPAVMYVLTKKCLYEIDWHTGKVLRRVFLHKQFEFRDIQWNVNQKTIAIHSKSFRWQSENQIIDNIVDILVSFDLLLVMKSPSTILIYDFRDILKKGKRFDAELGEFCPEFNGVVGSDEDGLPFNISCDDLPPPLFDVLSEKHSFEIGGFPYSYICMHENHFKIETLRNRTLVIEIPTGKNFIEDDKCNFHSDESGRIIFTNYHLVRCLKQSHGTDEFKESYTITASPPEQSEEQKVIIPLMGYEDDLEVLYLVVLDERTSECVLSLYDDNNGSLLTSFPLEEKWDESAEHEIIFDIETFIHLVNVTSGRSHCYLYKFNRKYSGVRTEKKAIK
ncbi:DgyrCDS11680 [Dimorphilus gyrociliatus]|uniref:DgyrCDS11680 n=1 Tax=Dimorphilus gyrociliatus TaxID=2664684 RepID=A0A7I8W561_9ANNE|nr:DgyrCDS11680 [Dimorphilus gyrociliatus]